MKGKNIWGIRTMGRLAVFAMVLVGAASLARAEAAQSKDLSGRWTATIKKDDLAIPFRLDISVKGANVTGKLFNGNEDFETTSSAHLENGTLQLNFEHYLTSIIGHRKRRRTRWANRFAAP